MSMDMRPGFFLFEPSGWLRSATGSVRPGSVLPCSGWIGCGPVLPGLVLLCLFQSIPVYSSLFQSIPVYSGLFRSIPVHSGPFYSILFYSILFPVQSGPAQPGPVRSGSVPSVLSSPFPPRRSRPVPSQSSLAQPGPAQLGPVRPVPVCGSGAVAPVGRALCGLTVWGGPRSNG